MKTILATAVMAALCLFAPTIHANHEFQQTPLLTISTAVDFAPAMLIGAGTIKSKNGNNYVVRSDDGNFYFANSETAYAVNDYVNHSDPVLGWVEILGHAD